LRTSLIYSNNLLEIEWCLAINTVRILLLNLQKRRKALWCYDWQRIIVNSSNNNNNLRWLFYIYNEVSTCNSYVLATSPYCGYAAINSFLILKLDCAFSFLFNAGLRLTMWSNSLSFNRKSLSAESRILTFLLSIECPVVFSCCLQAEP
jgi:hypothetical protein